jgi:hypothetical protein
MNTQRSAFIDSAKSITTDAMKTYHPNLQRRSRSPIGALAGFLLVSLGAAELAAQGFNAGSNGSLGDVVIAASTNIALPPDGVLHFASLRVESGATVTFTRNARNTPVYILSQGDVVVNGTIDVSGSGRTANAGGVGGPGGFDGGSPGFGAETLPGNGYGPGGGQGGGNNCFGDAGQSGGGSFGTAGIGVAAGATYGNQNMIPMIGGSGGGGAFGANAGGGGGGGAVLIASNTRILVDGTILASGGAAGACHNGGSGGSIRLVSMAVAGAGNLSAFAGGGGGSGRIRVDSIDRSRVRFNFNNIPNSIGSNLLVFPPVQPTLTLTEVAGTPIPEGTIPGTIFLPFDSPTNRTVKLRAKDFGRSVNVRVTLTPDSGAKAVFDTTIDNAAENPAEKTVDVVVPVNTKVTVHCWSL